MTRVAFRISIEMLRNRILCQRIRLITHAFNHDLHLLLELIKFILRHDRVVHNIEHQLKSGRKILSRRREVRNGTGHLQFGHTIFNLRTRHRLCSAGQHRCGNRLKTGLTEKILLVTGLELHADSHGFTACLFRQQSNIQITDIDTLCSLVEVIERRVKSFNLLSGSLRLVVRQQFFCARGLCDLCALRIVIRNEKSDDAVVSHEILISRTISLLSSDVFGLIASVEEKSPVTKCNVLGQTDTESFRIGKGAFVHRFHLSLGSSQLFRSHRLLLQRTFNRLDELIFNFF